MTVAPALTASRRIVILLIAGLGVLFIAYLGLVHRQELALRLAQAQWGLVTGALFALLASNIGGALVFSDLAAASSADVMPRRERIVGAFLLSQVAKYVPGRVWGGVVQRVALGRAFTLPQLISVNVDLAAIAVTVTCGSGVSYALWSRYGLLSGLLGIAITLVMTYAAAWSRPASRIRAALGSRRNHCLVDADLSRLSCHESGLSRTGMAGVALLVVGYAVGWWAIVRAVTTGQSEALELAAISSLSYVVGLVSMLPAGLGAREAFLVGIADWLSSGVGSATVVAIVTRVAIMAVDLLSFPVACVLLAFSRRG